MGKNRILHHAVRAVLATAAASAAGSIAFAQTAPPTTTTTSPTTAQQAVPSSTSDIGEIVVTGSRIQSTNLVSISPVVTVSATEIAQTGATRIEDVLNSLPNVFAGQTSTISNGSDGTASVDLHDLGPSRTLVLVNGRRLAPGAADGRNYADIDQIPVSLIDHVELLTGGASSTYGADAVAGVVNFIMNTHYEGVKLDVGYGMYQHNNHNSLDQSIVSGSGDALPPSNVNTGFQKNLAFTAGQNFDDGRGNATVYATWQTQAAVLQSKYDYSACTLAAGSTGRPVCGGSETNAGGTFLAYNSTTGNILRDSISKQGVLGPLTSNELYNYGPLNYYLRPSEKYTAGAFLNYDVNDHANVYAEISYMRNNTTAQLAPDGDFADNGPLANGSLSINCGPVGYNAATGVSLPGNPLLTPQERSVLCSPALLAKQGQPADGVLTTYLLRRNVEGGGRQYNYVSDDYRTVIGIKGEIVDGIKYDAYGQVGINDEFTSDGNLLNTQALGYALDVVEGPNGPACAAALSGAAPKCVPWNIYTPGGVTPAALAYLSIPLTSQGSVKEYVASANLTVDLGKFGVQLPTAKSGVIVNAGTEYRQEESVFLPDYAEQDSLSSNGSTLPLSGEFHVSEVFAEFNAPILDDLPGAQQLALDGGFRYSSYNLGFTTNTYKFGVEYAPVKDIRFRGSFSQAARAPNISELYTSATVGPNGTTDPCWGSHPTLTQAQCARTGVTGTQYGNIGANPANQFNTAVGGNPNLSAEIAHTYTYGFVVQPEILPSFSASVDYYDIKITGAIAAQSGTAVILGCAVSDNAADCADIHRGANGSLWLNNTEYVSTLEANQGLQDVKGIDVALHYSLPIDPVGKLAFNVLGTDVLNNITQPAVTVPNSTGTGFVTGPSYDCAGYNGNVCGQPLPRWRSTTNVDWLTPWSGLDVNLRWRYIGPTLDDGLSQSSLLNNAGSVYPGYERIPSYSYIDLTAAVNVATNVTVRVGVNNLFDKDPPTVLSGDCPTGSCNGNTWAATYDVLGRYLFAQVSAKF